MICSAVLTQHRNETYEHAAVDGRMDRMPATVFVLHRFACGQALIKQEPHCSNWSK